MSPVTNLKSKTSNREIAPYFFLYLLEANQNRM